MSSGGNPLLPELEEGSDSEVLVTPTRSEDEVEKKSERESSSIPALLLQ